MDCLVKKIAFRVDASIHIGFGHVMRCLTLAKALTSKHTSILFICRRQEGDLNSYIKSQGFQIFQLPEVNNRKKKLGSLGTTQLQDAEDCYDALKKFIPDLLIVDHYSIDFNWQLQLKNTFVKLMVIDDLGNRKHNADLILDQNFGSNGQKYKGLVPPNCRQLLGPNFALLRDEFLHLRKKSLLRRNKFNFNKVLINMGGTDSKNYTCRILELLLNSKILRKIKIIVAISSKCPHLEKIKKISSTNQQILLKVDSNNIAELMFQADIAIGASGSSTWERCCLGIPSIQFILAENQKSLAHALSEINAIKLIDELKEIPELLETSESWAYELTQNSINIVDGKGASRVASVLLNEQLYKHQQN